MAPYRINAAGHFGYTPLVNNANAAQGHRYTGSVPSTDAVAPRAGASVLAAEHATVMDLNGLSQPTSGRGHPGVTSAEARFSS